MIEKQQDGFTRRLDFIPAFDRRSDDPKKNYGISAMRMRFVLIGVKGAVQWMIGTPWYTASAREHLTNFPHTDFGSDRRPSGWDLGYHSPVPMYEGQTHMGSCDVLPGECFYDGSSLQADLLIEGFLTEGEDYVWSKLGAYYAHRFEDAAWPFSEDTQ